MLNEFNYVTCKKCGHDRNASTLKKCEICGQKMTKGSLPSPLIGIGILLLAMLGVSYFLFKDKLGSPAANNPISASVVAPTPFAAPSSQSTEPPVDSPLEANAPAPGKFDLITSANPELYQTLSQIPNVPQGTFNYGGSTTFAPLRADSVVSNLSQAHSEFALRYTEPIGEKPGSGSGIKMLLDGQLSFSQSSRPVKNAEFAQAQQRGFKLEQVPVAIDGIAFYANPGLSVPGLTLAQVKDIFTGKVTNWKELGGPNLKITPFSRNAKAGGTVDFFIEGVLEKQTLGSSVQEIRDTTDSIRQVAKMPGGIGYATASEVIGQKAIRALPLAKDSSQGFTSPFAEDSITAVNQDAFANGSYPLTRRLFVVIKRDGRLDEQAGVAYANMILSNEGQELVEKAGFVPLH